jgi:hypothetical protein
MHKLMRMYGIDDVTTCTKLVLLRAQRKQRCQQSSLPLPLLCLAMLLLALTPALLLGSG